jgi:hypothetical protein
MRIKTSYDYPPIPLRNFDWSAIDDATYDGPGCPVGHGATEAEAISELRSQLAEQEGHCEECGEHIPEGEHVCAECAAEDAEVEARINRALEDL